MSATTPVSWRSPRRRPSKSVCRRRRRSSSRGEARSISRAEPSPSDLARARSPSRGRSGFEDVVPSAGPRQLDIRLAARNERRGRRTDDCLMMTEQPISSDEQAHIDGCVNHILGYLVACGAIVVSPAPPAEELRALMAGHPQVIVEAIRNVVEGYSTVPAELRQQMREG